MYTYDKLEAVAKLVSLGQSYSLLADEVVAMIDKVVSPTKPIPGDHPSARQPVSPTIDELFVARAHGKIPAIKAYRFRTGLGLKESKDNIEKALNYFGWSTHYADNNAYPAFLFEQTEEPVPF